MERRIDTTLARLADMVEALPQTERAQLESSKQWTAVVIVSRLRGMERAEEDFGHPVKGVADDYDRLVQPGESAIAAILRVAPTDSGEAA